MYVTILCNNRNLWWGRGSYYYAMLTLILCVADARFEYYRSRMYLCRGFSSIYYNSVNYPMVNGDPLSVGIRLTRSAPFTYCNCIVVSLFIYSSLFLFEYTNSILHYNILLSFPYFFLHASHFHLYRRTPYINPLSFAANQFMRIFQTFLRRLEAELPPTATWALQSTLPAWPTHRPPLSSQSRRFQRKPLKWDWCLNSK